MKAFKRIILFEVTIIIILIGLVFTNFYSLLLTKVSSQAIFVVLSILFIAPGSLRPLFLIYKSEKIKNIIFPIDRYQSLRKRLYFLMPSLVLYFTIGAVEPYFDFPWLYLFLVAILVMFIIVMMFVDGKDSTFDFIELGEKLMFISASDFTKGYELILPRDSEHVQIEEDKIVVLANRKRFTKLGQIMYDGEEKMEISIPFCFLKKSDVLSLKEYLKKEAV